MDAITGINGNVNLLACFLFLLMPFLIIGFFELEKPSKIFALIGCIGNLIFLAILQTRAALVGMGVTSLSIFLMYVIYKKNVPFKQIILWMTITFFASAALIFFFRSNLSEISSRDVNGILSAKSFEPRKLLWKKSFQMFEDHPIAGVGAGNWRTNLPNYTLTGFIDEVQNGQLIPDRPHNDFLWTLSETGLIGFFSQVAIFILLIGYAYKVLNRNGFSWRLVIPLSSLLGYLTISMFSFPKERIESVVMVNIIMGLLYAFIQTEITFPASFKLSIQPTYIRVIGASFLLVILFFGLIRAKGEYYARKLISARQIGDFKNVIYYSNKSISLFYKLDNFGIPISWYRGSAYISMEDYENALHSFSEAYMVAPFNIQVLNNLASSLEVLGYHEKAKSIYLEAIRISPGFEDPKLNLAAIYYNEGNYRTALQWTQSVAGNGERKQKYKELIYGKINKR
ncbi:MAG: O-antigen ligase family protein [Bacteroidetes bacterium]|nr:O-antigen ligase family protein [Bacteroidota bacterium]